MAYSNRYLHSVKSVGQFSPDVIAEVTTACDRNCPGCYSPTLVSKQTPEELYVTNPELFMTPEILEASLAQLPTRANLTIALRGGEPSRHYKLAELVNVAAKYCKTIYVESHSRWLLQTENALHQTWMKHFRHLGVIVKISFDSMHALKSEQLQSITNALDANGVLWQVAVTEKTEEEFNTVRETCYWIPDEKILFQKKVRNHNELIQPPLGTIDVRGVNNIAPTAKTSFYPAPEAQV